MSVTAEQINQIRKIGYIFSEYPEVIAEGFLSDGSITILAGFDADGQGYVKYKGVRYNPVRPELSIDADIKYEVELTDDSDEESYPVEWLLGCIENKCGH